MRGCGTRDPHSTYVEFKPKPFGLPWSYFMIDPPKPWKGGQLRAPEKFTREMYTIIARKDGEKVEIGCEDLKEQAESLIENLQESHPKREYELKREEITHLVLGVGKKYYPFVPDFLEEAKKMGISKKIPRNFPFDELTPRKSRMLLIHPRVFPQFEYEVEHEKCPWERLEKRLKEREEDNRPHLKRYNRMIREKLMLKPGEHTPCLGDLWSLSYSKLGGNKKHRIEKEEEGVNSALVRTPSVSYYINKPIKRAYGDLTPSREYTSLTDSSSWNYGIFFQFPINTICYTSKEVPEHIREKTAGFRLRAEEVEKDE